MPGSVTSTASSARRAASAACSSCRRRASRASASSSRRAFTHLPTAGRSSGGSSPMPLKSCVRTPFFPRNSTRAPPGSSRRPPPGSRREPSPAAPSTPPAATAVPRVTHPRSHASPDAKQKSAPRPLRDERRASAVPPWLAVHGERPPLRDNGRSARPSLHSCPGPCARAAFSRQLRGELSAGAVQSALSLRRLFPCRTAGSAYFSSSLPFMTIEAVRPGNPPRPACIPKYSTGSAGRTSRAGGGPFRRALPPRRWRYAS